MSTEDKEKDTGVIESIINLGTATTKLTLDQMQNAFQAITHPTAAMEHVKETMNNLSEAMNSSASGRTASSGRRVTVTEAEPVSNDLRGAATGMEHLSDDAPIATARPAASARSTTHPINRRKG